MKRLRHPTARQGRPGRGLVSGALFAALAVASIYAFALVHRQPANSLQERVLPVAANSAPTDSTEVIQDNHAVSTTEFGQFPPQTKAERELDEMLRGKDEAIDLALASWLIAADIPEFADMTREWYFAQLDTMLQQVRQEMARMEGVAKSRGQDPNDTHTRCGIFCNAIIKLQFAYAEEFRGVGEPLTLPQKKALHGNPNNTFLAGLLRTRRGSCVSMPLIYLAIGHRLGYAVHLVSVGDHYFIRWEEPGYRLNIEATRIDKVWVTDDDSAYVESLGVKPDFVKGSALRNLTRREVVGQLFFERSAYWVAAQRSRLRSWVDLARARHLSPEDPNIIKTCEGIFGHYDIKPEDNLASLKHKAGERN